MNTPTLYDSVRAAARRIDPALIAGEHTWTYGDLLDAAAEFAAAVVRRPEPAAPVIAEVSDPFGTAVAALGGDLAGVAVVHRDSGAADRITGWIVHDGRRAAPADGEIPCAASRLWLRTEPEAGGGDLPAWPSDLPGGSQVFLTSGSTGVPSAVVRTADAVLADARRVAAYLSYTADGPVVAAAPLFHAYGFNYGLLGPLLCGSAVRWCPSRSVPSQLGRAVRETGARTLIALPAHYGLLASQPGLAEPTWDAMLATLRSAVSAGAPLAPGVAAVIATRFRFAFYNCYGSSEAGAVTLARLTGDEEVDWIGDPLPGVAARVVPLDGSSATGELQIRTTSLAIERLGPHGRQLLADAHGWYPTGDLAVADPAGGGIRVVGRLSSVINVAGRKVSPAEIERVLITHPQIVEVQVVGAPDTARGQMPVARVVVRNALEVPDLVTWCRDRLAPHQVPRRFELVPVIPRSATGKPLAYPEPTP